jgi:hypothetical protein
MIEGTYQERNFKPGAMMKSRRSRMTTKDTRTWVVIGVILLSILLFWGAALVSAYLADDVSPTPADERSVPAPRSY